MKFKTHIPNEQASAVLTKLLARDLSITTICRLSGVSRKAVDNIRAGKNCRKATLDKLAAAVAVLELREMVADGWKKTEKQVAKLTESNEAYADAHASLWGRIKAWLIARFY